MNKPDPKCAKCAGSMVQGFSLDKGDHHLTLATRWVEGPVEKTMWGNVDTKGRDCRAIVLWRCVKCGYLEAYANEPAELPGFFTP